MKKIGMLWAALVALTLQAQQLPNYGFSAWKTACGNTEAFGTGTMASPKKGEMRQRPGVEPDGWNGSSINQKVIMEKKQQLIYNDNGLLRMTSVYVGVGSMGSVAPGFITLGTPWVYASSTLSDCDGGVYGGINFTYQPDALTGRYKRTDSNTSETSHIIAYMWNSEYSSKVGKKSNPDQVRTDVDRAILGKTTPTSAGTLVASCDYTFTSTGGDWQEITVPLNYVYSSSVAPQKLNVIISGADYWDRSKMVDGTTLYADDIRFVYYSTLASLSYNGVSLTVPENEAMVDLSSESFDAAKLKFTVNGRTAVANYTLNEENLLTLTVTNVGTDIDNLSSHTYYLQFANGQEEVVPTIMSEGEELLVDETQTVDMSHKVYSSEGWSFEGFAENIRVVKKYDARSGLLTIILAEVSAEGEFTGSYKEYKYQFEAPVKVTTFSEPLIITLMDVSTDSEGRIVVSEMSNGTRVLMINDFSFGELPVGDIVIDGLTTNKVDGVDVYTYKNTANIVKTMMIAPGSNADLSFNDYLGPMLGDITLAISAESYKEEAFHALISIDLTDLLGYTVDVEAGSVIKVEGEETGVEHTMQKAQTTYDVYTLQGVCVRKAAKTLKGLAKGAYIVNGKTVFLR